MSGEVYRNIIFRTLVENRAKMEAIAASEQRSLGKVADMLIQEALARRAEREDSE